MEEEKERLSTVLMSAIPALVSKVPKVDCRYAQVCPGHTISLT